jgi:YidC/Oxa1 family membrane protein insertase
MFLQQKLSFAGGRNSGIPKTQEAKLQENMMYALPGVFTYICSSFPVGVVIYWTISNVFSIVQQHYINNKLKRKRN